MTQPLLETKSLNMEFGSGSQSVRALSDINIKLFPGEVVAIVGPSGCGKSTLLSLVSGILRPTSGQLLYRQCEITGPSRERVIIFQDHALFPWLTVRQNIEFALHAQGLERAEVNESTETYLNQVGMSDFADFFPRQLSGGMQQRVGIARALAANPELLLLDEPFASLDIIKREILIGEFLALSKRLRKSTFLVTHNIEEAILMGDRIYLMSASPGKVDREIEVTLNKSEASLELRKKAEFIELERTIHEYLSHTNL